MAVETKESDHHNDAIDELKRSESHVEEVVIARLTEEDMMTLSAESLNFWSKTGFRLVLVMFVQGCNQAGYGIDWAVIGGLNALDPWHEYFGIGTSGGTLGVINALMTIGTVCGAIFLAMADIIGRRGINFLGNFIVICAAIMQGVAKNMPTFMAGRFFLGFGSALMSSSTYMAEIAPLHLRGRIVGLFGACFQIGSLVMSGVMMVFGTITNDWGWRIPLLLEAFFPVIVCSLIYLVTPESPRYLVKRGKIEEAKSVIARYQTTSGSIDEPLVGHVVRQIEESLENERAGYTEWWDYRAFFTRTVAFRLFILVLYSIFQQWNGGGIITTYLVPSLEIIGIVDALPQLGISLGLTATYFVFTGIGSVIIDYFRRRTLIFAGLISIILLQTASTITSWRYTVTQSSATAILTLVWIFSFQICSSMFIATMHNLYPVEILSLALRAKGMGLYGLIQGAAGTVQNYGISVGINKLGYKIWAVYVAYNTIQLIVSYFVFPETYGLSLEEIDAVFETPGVHPVKMSLDIQKAKKERARMENEAATGAGV
ncbi:hypothetical protein VTO42DRAFT_4496 [Malbranchea cinnamomea]